jgi:RNA polymerase sigma-70 factor (ECF subfamily)
MSEVPRFDELFRRVRSGDQEAAAILVREYEPAIRRVARLRLGNVPLQGMLDSTDICQSVLASFFLRAASGQYAFETPAQLVNLLATMARSKLAAQVRRQQAQKRDRRRQHAVADDGQLAGNTPTPSREFAARDLLSQVRCRLTPEELRLVDLRTAGHDWAEVAAQVGAGAEAVRKKHARALDRVSRELGLDEPE